MRRSTGWAGAIISTWALALVPAQAGGRRGHSAAEAAFDAAAPWVQEGQALFKAKDYEGALAKFRQAEATLEEAEVTEATLYFAIGRAYDQLGQIVAAGRYFRRFVGQANRKVRGVSKMLRRADQAIARIDAQLDRTQLTFEIEPPGAEVRVDRRELGEAPIDDLKVTPGPHQITVWAEGYEGADVSVDVRPGAEVPVVVSLAPLRQASDDGPSDAALGWMIGGVSALVVSGVVALVVLTRDEPAKEYRLRTTMQGL